MTARTVALAAGASALLALHAWYFDHVADDAYITLRYLDSWLRGDGLVFNPGEWVMGYSNPLWLLALAPLGLAGIGLPAAAQGLGLALSIGCVGLVCHESARRQQTWLAPLAAGGWLAASGPFALWAQAGLEGPLFALCLTGAAVAAGRHAESGSARSLLTVCIALAAAAWTRPEGAAYGLVVAGWLAWRTGARAAAAALGATVAAWLVFGALALWHYGDWLPNTYYAKSHPLSLDLLERGWRFTWAYVKGQSGATPLALLLFAVTAGRRAQAPGWLGVALIGAFVVFYLSVGGDALVYHRMWAYVQPLLALALGDAAGWLARRSDARLRVAATLVCALPLLALPNSLRGFELAYLRGDDARIRSLAALGHELARRAAPDTVIATNVIGALGYTSRLPVVDMLGLTDRHIAQAGNRSVGIPGHESHDAAYVLDREPDLILVGIPRASTTPLGINEAFQPAFPSDRALLADPRFERDYGFGHLTLQDGRTVALFRRRGFAELD